jgi:hypothetical protein
MVLRNASRFISLGATFLRSWVSCNSVCAVFNRASSASFVSRRISSACLLLTICPVIVCPIKAPTATIPEKIANISHVRKILSAEENQDKGFIIFGICSIVILLGIGAIGIWFLVRAWNGRYDKAAFVSFSHVSGKKKRSGPVLMRNARCSLPTRGD